MKMPTWARGAAKTSATAPIVKAKAKSTAPTIRDDAWWVEKMHWWRKDDPERMFPVGKVGLWLELPAENAPVDLLDPLVRTNGDMVLERVAAGEQLGKIAEGLTELFGVRVSQEVLRMRLTATHEGRTKYNIARQHFAHRLVDGAVNDITLARSQGDVRWAGEFSLKMAGRIDPENWGEKTQINLGGVAGKPVEYKKIEQTPAEAMRAALGHKE